MRGGRASIVALAMAALALAVVGLRAEQTRRAAKVLSLESRWVQLRRDQWSMQARAARLRTPDRLHTRLGSADPLLRSPGSTAGSDPSMRLAFRSGME